jgi:putative MATE family efflux protein
MASPGSNLTSGSLWRGIAGLALPMMASAALQNLQGVIDLYWVGGLGESAVAALAVSGTILMLLFPVVMGLSTGTVAVVSRSIGAALHREASEAGGQSLLLALLCGLGAGGIGWFSADWLCRLLGGEGEVLRLGGDYLRISFLGSFTMFALFMGNSILMASGNTVLPMFAMVLASVLNLGLDPLLIYGWLGFPRLEVAGAGLATVLSQAIAAGWVVWALLRGKGGVRIGVHAFRFRPGVAWRLMRLGIPSSGQMLSRSLMSAVMMRVVAGFGTAAMAAYGIGIRFHMVILLPAFVLGNAVATIAGQNLGASRPERAERAAWMGVGVDAVIMAASAVVVMTWAEPLVRLFNSLPEVVSIGVDFFLITSLFNVFAALSIVLGRALQGAGDTVSPMISTIVGLWVVQVPLALWLPRFFVVPTRGIWWAMSLAMMANGLMVTAWFCRGRWKRSSEFRS